MHFLQISQFKQKNYLFDIIKSFEDMDKDIEDNHAFLDRNMCNICYVKKSH